MQLRIVDRAAFDCMRLARKAGLLRNSCRICLALAHVRCRAWVGRHLLGTDRHRKSDQQRGGRQSRFIAGHPSVPSLSKGRRLGLQSAIVKPPLTLST